MRWVWGMKMSESFVACKHKFLCAMQNNVITLNMQMPFVSHCIYTRQTWRGARGAVFEFIHEDWRTESRGASKGRWRCGSACRCGRRAVDFITHFAICIKWKWCTFLFSYDNLPFIDFLRFLWFPSLWSDSLPARLVHPTPASTHRPEMPERASQGPRRFYMCFEWRWVLLCKHFLTNT